MSVARVNRIGHSFYQRPSCIGCDDCWSEGKDAPRPKCDLVDHNYNNFGDTGYRHDHFAIAMIHREIEGSRLTIDKLPELNSFSRTPHSAGKSI